MDVVVTREEMDKMINIMSDLFKRLEVTERALGETIALSKMLAECCGRNAEAVDVLGKTMAEMAEALADLNKEE